MLKKSLFQPHCENTNTFNAAKPSRRSFLITSCFALLALSNRGALAMDTSLKPELDAIHALFEAQFFNPDWLNSPEYLALRRHLQKLAQTEGPDGFRKAFNSLWEATSISHVDLSGQKRSATELADFFDVMEVGPNAVDLTWDGNIAILSVRTLMGRDTEERITAAYQDIVEKKAKGLVIDLRGNPGGAFAMINLAGHCLAEPTDAGIFLTKRWYEHHDMPPSWTEVDQIKPWEGASLVALWDHVGSVAAVRLRFPALKPHYSGPLAILINDRTASAAELVTELLQSNRAAKVIGEQSSGGMLMQKPFDVTNRFILSLPIADYISRGSGRIEGVGIKPDIEIASDLAKSTALKALHEQAR